MDETDIKAGQIWQHNNTNKLYHVIAIAYTHHSSISHTEIVVYFQPGDERVYGCSVDDWRRCFKCVFGQHS